MPHNEYYELPKDFQTMVNIADAMSEEQLSQLGSEIKAQVDIDISSRSEWLEKNDKWMKLITQVLEPKSYPWPNASNIKFPLISTAAVQFHARAFPALLGNNRPVKARVIGRDPKSIKTERANRVSTFMSYQILEDMDGWMEDMDRLLFIVPIIGSLYKKTYYSEVKKKAVSELIHPKDLIINYDAMDIKDARKAHRLWKTPNAIVSLQNRALWRELDDAEEPLIELPKVASEVRDKVQGLSNPGTADDYALQEIFEVHILLDLDNDGYKEPYICTIREVDGAIYRLTANYKEKDVERIGDKVVEITPEDFFTHYFFLPDPESKTHGIGFGTMIGPINEAVNTILNQLTDAGHMNTLGGGFLSRGLRIKGGALRFKPNEWKTINATGDDLRKSIFPMPTKEPSTVLFQLLGLLIDSGKDLSSVQDQMVGRSPGQNQPFATTEAVMEQGLKVFNGIYKRLYRAMTSEFKKIYRINREHPDPVKYLAILDFDGQEGGEAMKKLGPEEVLSFLANDFSEDDIDIIPTAEPDMIMESQKIQRATALMQKLAAGVPLNKKEVIKRVLEAEGHEDIGALMDVPEPGPPPEFRLEVEKFEHQKQVDGLELKLKALKTQSEVLANNMDAELKFATAQKTGIEGLHAQFIEQKRIVQEQYDNVTKRLKVLVDGKKNDMADRKARQPTESSK